MPNPTMFNNIDKAQNGRTLFASVGFLVCLTVFVWLSIQMDLFADTTNIAWPLLVIFLAWSLPALGFVLLFRRRWMLAIYGLGAGAVLVLLMTPWHPRKVF